ncbi:hypothetical protein [Salipiger thiooxidans]|uniref:hypothetical protein n=1 Tax=Salipiger thiooxidans TaxID=282683 RepID=UPI001CF9A853|nr:hypothetical protein [Salipiger thiooxidans]
MILAFAAPPVSAQVRLGDQLAAVRLAGSEHMMVHTLSTLGLPVQARVAREKLLGTMGMRGRPGSVSYTNLSFAPVINQDSNINGGYASDTFTVSRIPFSIGKEYEAVDGLVLGLSGSGRARLSLGRDTALDLRTVASIGYAPEHDMFKTSAAASACVEHMVSYSTFLHGCLDANYRQVDLGETSLSSARVGVSRVFGSDIGMHEAKAELQMRHVSGGVDYSQAVASFSLNSAFAGPYALNMGFQLGEEVDGMLVMRERAFVGLGFLTFDQPTSVSLAVQSNRGGEWLGEGLTQTVTSLSLSHQFSDRISVSGFVSQAKSSDEFFDDTQYGLNIAWRF